MTPADTALLVIDVQEKLMPILPRAKELIRNIAFLIDAAKVMDIPVFATEQYTKGLGPTVADLAARLPRRFEKMAFSCCGVAELTHALHLDARPRVLLTGIMAHVCVLQSALDLLGAGFRVYAAADAVAATDDVDHTYALRRLEQAGAILTTSESAAFEWVGGAGTPEFKQISRLVQERMRAARDESSQ
jgi:nicotinamidase-related amidase